MYSRREFLQRTSQVIEGAAVFAVSKACYTQDPNTPKPVDPWRGKSPTERLFLLEKEQSSIADSEVRKEIALAVGETICSQMRCNKTASEMASSLHFLPPQDFLNRLEQTIGIKLSDTDKRRELDLRLEFIGNNKQVYINNPLWEKVNINLPPNVRSGLAGRNTAMVIGKSLDFHAFTHLIESKEEFTFSPFSFIAYGLRVARVGKMIGLKFEGEDETGNLIYLTGAHEASTELAARIMANRKAPPYISLAYTEASNLLFDINRAAKISDDDFLKFKEGSFNTEWYLRKIASIQNSTNPNIKNAILALALIALAQAGAITWPEARRGVFDTWLSPKQR